MDGICVEKGMKCSKNVLLQDLIATRFTKDEQEEIRREASKLVERLEQCQKKDVPTSLRKAERR